jgi:hypothetical protein
MTVSQNGGKGDFWVTGMSSGSAESARSVLGSL